MRKATLVLLCSCVTRERALKRGDACRAKEQWDRAIRHYTRAIELDPNSAEAYYGRGAVRAQPGDSVYRTYDAIQDLSRAIELRPDYAKAYHNRGVAHARCEQWPPALCAFTRAIELDPDCARTYVSRGRTHCLMGAWGNAVSDLTQAVTLDPGEAEAYHVRAYAYSQKHDGDADRALADALKVIELDPDSCDAYWFRGDILFDRGDRDAAMRDYARAIGLDDFFPPDVAPDRRVWIPCRVEFPDDIQEIQEKRRSDGTTKRVEARKQYRETYEEGWYAYMEAFVKTGSVHDTAFDGNVDLEDTTGPRLWSSRIEPARDKGFVDCREAIRAYYREQGTWAKSFKPLHEIALLNAGASIERNDEDRPQRVSLGGPEVTDALMDELAQCSDVQRVCLSRTSVTDDGLRHLARLKRLSSVALKGTKVTPEGVERLKTALPDCNTYLGE